MPKNSILLNDWILRQIFYLDFLLVLPVFPPSPPEALVADFLPPEDFAAVLRSAVFFVPPEEFLEPPEDLDAVFLTPLPEAFFPALSEDLEAFLVGTLAPFSRTSDQPIAIACLGDVTFLPLRPLFSFPSFISCIAVSTFLPAAFEYFAIWVV